VLPNVASFGLECEPERLGTRQLRIIPYTGKRAYQYYIDGLKVNGKRQKPGARLQARASRSMQTYWYPLYVFVRRRGQSPSDINEELHAFCEALIATGGG